MASVIQSCVKVQRRKHPATMYLGSSASHIRYKLGLMASKASRKRKKDLSKSINQSINPLATFQTMVIHPQLEMPVVYVAYFELIFPFLPVIPSICLPGSTLTKWQAPAFGNKNHDYLKIFKLEHCNGYWRWWISSPFIPVKIMILTSIVTEIYNFEIA